VGNIKLDFYGYGVHIASEVAEIIRFLNIDYSYFKSDEVKADVRIEIFNKKYNVSSLPEMVTVFSTPRNVCYFKDDVNYIDYFGGAMTLYDRANKKIEIFSEDVYLAHAAAYQAILSLAGQYLDKKAYHRVHSVGFDFNGKAVIIMMDTGSGKTDLTLRLLNSKDQLKLISEDTPLVARGGEILPFPLRIGVRDPKQVSNVPEDRQIHLPLLEFGPKDMIDVAFFGDRISRKSSNPWILIVGKRSTYNEPKISQISKPAVFNNVFKNQIMALGMYQGLEFMLKSSPFNIFKKFGIVFSRFINSLVLIFKSKTFCLILSKDTNKNYEFLLKFLHRQERS